MFYTEHLTIAKEKGFNVFLLKIPILFPVVRIDLRVA